MSRENVEIVRRVYDAIARRDRGTVLGLYDPGVEVYFSHGTLADLIGGTQGNRWMGHEGLRAFDRELREAFENFETTCTELIDAGGKVVTVTMNRGRGRHSGVEINGPLQFGVWSIREGKVARVDWYPTRSEALDAAGVQE